MDDPRYEWDEAKNRQNLAKHGFDFSKIAEFAWLDAVETLQVVEGEVRWKAVGRLGERIVVVIYTERREKLRIISLREAEPREIGDYVKAKSQG